MSSITRYRPILNWVAFIITLIINAISQQPGYFMYTAREAGEMRALFFLPAGYVFGIWGIIYLGIGAWLTYQIRPINRDNPIHEQVGWWFIVSCIGNVGWILLFLNDQTWLSTLAMGLLLVSLLMIYTRLGVGRKPVSTLEKWVVHIPFSIYLGWITVATVANIAAALYSSGNVTGFLGISADLWTVIMMVIAAGLALAMIFVRRDVAYALVVVWALVGIYARPFDTDVYSIVASLNAGLVNTGALVLAIAIVAAIVIGIFVRRTPDSLTPQRT